MCCSNSARPTILGFFSGHMEIDFRILDDSCCIVCYRSSRERTVKRQIRPIFLKKIPLNRRLVRASELPKCVAFSPFNEIKVKTERQNQPKSPQKYTRTQNRAQLSVLLIISFHYNKMRLVFSNFHCFHINTINRLVLERCQMY